MRGIIPSGTVFLIIYVASLITMILITLKFIIGTPVVITLKYTPRFTASYIGLSAVSDPKGWLYSRTEVGQKFNIRNYYGILNVFKIAYDVKFCPFNWSFCNKTCVKYCFNEYNGSSEYVKCINECIGSGKSEEECEEECNNTGFEGCKKICEKSCDEVYLGKAGCYSSLLKINNDSISYPIVEGGDILNRTWSINFSSIAPMGYLGYRNYIEAIIPHFDLLSPYIIEIKIYDLDYLKKKIEETPGYYDEERSILTKFTITTYCPYDKDLRSCRKGSLLYELSFPVLLTSGEGWYWNGFFVVRIYDWKKT